MTGSQFSEANDDVTYDPEANAYYAQHEWSSDDSVSVTLVTVLADIMDADPMSIDPLSTHVNPDALDSLFDTQGGDSTPVSGRLELPIDGYHVTIYADGEIVVRP
ncbi:HalOD1 output domain-containing protein [Halostella sp. PRR32]|uniref:HalOD1 output domain-containing protein n=1 Tax=Halostella sp. PRR32 TaxID=3098147 RepID=UPI002B1DEB9B|nr:HalOD1 output domain-containing protein [Halostella sp. PRR32]